MSITNKVHYSIIDKCQTLHTLTFLCLNVYIEFFYQENIYSTHYVYLLEIFTWYKYYF